MTHMPLHRTEGQPQSYHEVDHDEDDQSESDRTEDAEEHRSQTNRKNE